MFRVSRSWQAAIVLLAASAAMLLATAVAHASECASGDCEEGEACCAGTCYNEEEECCCTECGCIYTKPVPEATCE